MAIEVLIDGVNATPIIAQGESTVNYESLLNGRTTLDFMAFDKDNVWDIQPGEEVILRDNHGTEGLFSAEGEAILSAEGEAIEAADVDVRFGGTVERVSYRLVGNRHSTMRQWEVEAVSFDQIADRHIVADVYEGWLAGEIFRDLVERFLSEDGVTADHVDDGPPLTFVLFNYITVAEAFNRLSTLSGMPWRIDHKRVAHFRPRDTAQVAFTVTTDDYHAMSLTVERTRERYRNSQIVRAGRDLTDPRTERFVGDDERRTFNVAFPVGTVPTITLDRGLGPVVQTVGIRGLDDGEADWYWNKDTTEISQDEAGVVLTPADTLEVTYRGLFPVIVVLRDNAEIAARQAIEGGSGRYEKVIDEPNIDSATVAADVAFAHLQRDGAIPTTLQLETLERVTVGEFIPAELTRERVDDNFLITSVRASFMVQDVFRATVEATDGSNFGGWPEYFRRLAAAQRAQLAREDETLISVRALGVPVRCVVALELLAAPPETRIGHLQIGIGEIGA